MAFTVEFEAGTARAWTLTETGATAEPIEDYTPALFVDGPAEALESLCDRLVPDPKVVTVAFEAHHTSLHAAHRDEPSRLLAVSLERMGEVRTLGHEIRSLHERGAHPPGTLRLFDVDLAPGFRFCLDQGRDPTPSRPLRTLSLELTDRALAQGDLDALQVGASRSRDHSSRRLRLDSSGWTPTYSW
ncbi:MAG: hypothetical protein U5K37_01105 [Natrialbaceae archaeon]|nr:hypothetical protein [Natrialbaceae archaeon]